MCTLSRTRPRRTKSPSRCSSTSAAARGAEKARVNIKKKLTGSIDVTNRIVKFVDCRTKDVERREVYIVEGDSAGACKQGRDAEFQAIIPGARQNAELFKMGL